MYVRNFGTKTLELVARGDFWIILWILWVWGWTQYLDGLFEPVRAWSKSVQLGLRSPSLWPELMIKAQVCDFVRLGKFVRWLASEGDKVSVGVQVKFYGPYLWSTECRQEIKHGKWIGFGATRILIMWCYFSAFALLLLCKCCYVKFTLLPLFTY